MNDQTRNCKKFLPREMTTPIAARILKSTHLCSNLHNLINTRNHHHQTRTLSCTTIFFSGYNKINLGRNKTSLFHRRLFSQTQQQEKEQEDEVKEEKNSNGYNLESLQTHGAPRSETRRHGIVKMWNRKKRYGFIVDNETGESHFVHCRNLNCGENSSFVTQCLHESQKVEFELGPGLGDRIEAINVSAPNGEILTHIVSPETYVVTGERRRGVTGHFERDKGHGFVVDRETNERIFVHYSNLICGEESRCLWPQQEIEFEINTNDDGKTNAVRVTSPGGIPLTHPVIVNDNQE